MRSDAHTPAHGAAAGATPRGSDAAAPTPPHRIAVVTLCSSTREDHLRNQLRMTAGAATRIVVWLDGAQPPQLDSELVIRCPPGPHGMRLSAARNLGADAAVRQSCGTIVFLDADCLPDPGSGGLQAGTLARYADVTRAHPGAIACGPVTYLGEGFALPARAGAAAGTCAGPASGEGPGARDLLREALALREARAPHAARPDPPADRVIAATGAEYPLFWSLSFAVSAELWAGGSLRFDETYEGYGGEDTDFAFRARAQKIPLLWVGGADAYHQYHPTQNPPRQHVVDILRNGAIFAESWGSWPMEGWLSAFEGEGLVRRVGDGWERA